MGFITIYLDIACGFLWIDERTELSPPQSYVL